MRRLEGGGEIDEGDRRVEIVFVGDEEEEEG